MAEIIATIKTVADAAKTIAQLITLVNDLREEVNTLRNEISELRTQPKADVAKNTIKERNIEDRKYSPQQIRYIFYLRDVRNMSGYKISKQLNENAPFIYNILNRKIYAEVNISNLTHEEFAQS